MIAELVTRLLTDSTLSRATQAGCGSRGRLHVAFRLRRDWLRHLSTALLLLVFSAFILQPLAHANPSGHAVHHDAAASAMAQPCAHASGDGETSAGHCDHDRTGPSLLDCCQACLVAGIIPEIRPLFPHMRSGHLSFGHPSHIDRMPPGILRPPRLIATA